MANTKHKEAEAPEPQVIVEHIGIPAGKVSPEEMEWLRKNHPYHAKCDDKEFQALAKEVTPPSVPGAGDDAGEGEPDAVQEARKAALVVLQSANPEPETIDAAVGAFKAAVADAQHADEERVRQEALAAQEAALLAQATALTQQQMEEPPATPTPAAQKAEGSGGKKHKAEGGK